MPQNHCHRQSLSLPALALAIWVAIGGSLACACTIPVFRYALERWESDRFLVIVFYDGKLTEEQNRAISELAERSSVVGGPLNIEVIRYDLASPSPPKLLDVKPPPADRPLPWIEIRARVAQTRTAVLWQEPLIYVAGQSGFFDSPARSEVVRRLLDGDSCVWLLVAPEEQVQKLSQQLQTMLDSAPEKLTLPQGIGLPGSELYSPIPLVIRFSVLPISHADPKEQAFLKLLAASTREWQSDTAYVIPVFGRCRALEVFPFADATEALIEDVGSFLCAACSCRVKQANPGFDLLVAVNWNERLFGDSLREPLPVKLPTTSASPAVGLPDAPEYLRIPAGNQPALMAEPTAATPKVEGRVAAGSSIGVTNVQQPHSTKKMLILAAVIALLGCGILAGAIFIRRQQSLR